MTMSENHLLRGHAPISDAVWALIDEEARERTGAGVGALTGGGPGAPPPAAPAPRRLVDFSGPHGWEHSATNLGRTEPIAAAPCEGVTALRRRVLELAEVRAPFALTHD